MNDTPSDESRADFMNLRLGFLRFDLMAEKFTNHEATKDTRRDFGVCWTDFRGGSDTNLDPQGRFAIRPFQENP